jgi:hypothetical protein
MSSPLSQSLEEDLGIRVLIPLIAGMDLFVFHPSFPEQQNTALFPAKSQMTVQLFSM